MDQYGCFSHVFDEFTSGEDLSVAMPSDRLPLSRLPDASYGSPGRSTDRPATAEGLGWLVRGGVEEEGSPDTQLIALVLFPVSQF